MRVFFEIAGELISGAVGLWAWAAFWRAFYAPSSHSGDEVHRVRFRSARDGEDWTIALTRFRPRREEGSLNQTVICCSGLGSNHYTFDLTADSSMAVALAEQGFDVWLLDLRNHGFSERRSWLFGPRRSPWEFDDYLHDELPAVFSHIEKITGQSRFHWIGHSMGGLLLYAWLASRGGERILSGVTLGSALEYPPTETAFARLLKVEGVLRRILTLPVRWLSAAVSPFAGRWHGTWIDRFNYNPQIMEPRLARILVANVLEDIPVKLLLQLKSALAPGGLRRMGGSGDAYLPGLATVRTPVLAVAGTADEQVSPAAVRKTVEALGGGVGKYREFAELGHFDLVIGREARAKVWPAIFDFIR